MLSHLDSDATVASPAQHRPETPVRAPAPGELDETRPQTRIELPASDLSVGAAVLEPITAGMYHLAYACLLVPRLSTHYLTGDMADKLSEWMPIVCVAFGWRLEYLAVRPEYLQWVAMFPEYRSGYLMRGGSRSPISSSLPSRLRENPRATSGPPAT
jgi:hypothetical protein